MTDAEKASIAEVAQALGARSFNRNDGSSSNNPERWEMDTQARPRREATAGRPRSDALKNLVPRVLHTAIRGDGCRDPSCGKGRRADKASEPDRGHSAIERPRPRRLERDPRASNASCQISGNCRARACRTSDENSAEISSSRIDPQNLQERALLTLPNGGEQALAEEAAADATRRNKAAMIRYIALFLRRWWWCANGILIIENRNCLLSFRC